MIAATTIGVVSQPLNDGCGSLKGAELALSPPFSPSLDGFGFYGSGS
jgi:iron complex outermembrane receptor protein